MFHSLTEIRDLSLTESQLRSAVANCPSFCECEKFVLLCFKNTVGFRTLSLGLLRALIFGWFGVPLLLSASQDHFNELSVVSLKC